MGRQVLKKPNAEFSDIVELLRPAQWVKNVVVFVAPAAGLKLLEGGAFLRAGAAFAGFCLAASACYAINDVVDREADRLHPTKRNRPVAKGAIQPGAAIAIGVGLLLAGVGLTFGLLNAQSTFVLVLYFFLTLTYSLVLKQVILLDVIVIATGFVLRAWAGAVAGSVPTSAWLAACMFTLCMFMGFGKRRCELAMMGASDDAAKHRRTLIRYTPDLLNHLITVSAGIAVMTFLLYTRDGSRTPTPFPKEQLFFTLPIVVYGVFRYAMVTELGLYSGPTEIVLRDRPLLLAILIWAIAALVIAYQGVLFGAEGWMGVLKILGVT